MTGHHAADAVPRTIEVKDHSVLVGYGRVGSLVGNALRARAELFVVIEDGATIVAKLRENGIEAIVGNAVRADVLAAANVAEARRLFVAIPNCFEAVEIVERARAVNPGLIIVARAHSDTDVQHLTSAGADAVIMGEREIALGMIQHVFARGDLRGRTEEET